MPWHSKVMWAEGLFLRPHHLQQSDRYAEHLVETRGRYATPYPWGFWHVEVDRDLAQQGKFAVTRAGGLFADGTPFDVPTDAVPSPIDVPDGTAGDVVWLSMPERMPGSREVDEASGDAGSRFVADSESLVDATSSARAEEEVDIARPRLTYELRRSRKPGYESLPIARVLEVHDRTIVFDEKFAPTVLVCAAHPVFANWMDRVIGAVETRLEELARYASDPSSGGGLQSADYLFLQLLNRTLPVLVHLRACGYTHPERLYTELVRFAGELATFSTTERRARSYPAYDHNALEKVFAPVLDDLQDFLSARLQRRAIRLPLDQRAPNAFVSPIRDRSLFRQATFILEVSARMPLTDIQYGFPQLFKVGPNTKMNDIVHTNLPGISLIHLPTPPSQIRSISDHLYFALDRNSAMWPEFSTAAAIGMHFSGDWPDLELDFWAVQEGRK